MVTVIASLILLAASLPADGASAVPAPPWEWPVVGPVTRAFDPPDSPYGAGHRGIDIAAGVRTLVRAPAPGKVTFAGPVGGRLFVTLNHGGGLESTYSWLDALLVRKGDVVRSGDPLARTGTGHTGSTVPHLHLGARLHGVYVDPLTYLGPVSVSGFIRLAPLAVAPAA